MNLIITADGIRHQFYAVAMSKVVPDYMIIQEHKEGTNGFGCGETDILGKLPFSLPKPLLKCDKVSEPKITEFIQMIKPDRIFVFGCSLLKPEIIDSAKYGVINLHTGYTQSYRGVDSSTWALCNKDYDNIGVTVHYVTPGIDDGDIIAQRQVQLLNQKNIDEVFIDTCKVGINLLLDVTNSILDGTAPRFPLHPKGKLYQLKDMSFDIQRDANDNLREYTSLPRRIRSYH